MKRWDEFTNYNLYTKWSFKKYEMYTTQCAHTAYTLLVD